MVFVTYQDIFWLHQELGGAVTEARPAEAIAHERRSGIGSRSLNGRARLRVRPASGRSRTWSPASRPASSPAVDRARPGRSARGPRRSTPWAAPRARARRWSSGLPRRPRLERVLCGAGPGRSCSPGAPPGAAGARGRPAPDPRLLGRQPRGRPGGRRPGRDAVLGLLARHRPSPRARRRQRRLLVSPGRPAPDLRPAGRGGPTHLRRAWRRRWASRLIARAAGTHRP